MTNKVEITITVNDHTDTGFASAKANATKAGKAYADAYKAEIIKGTRGVGTQVSKQVSTDMIAGSKGTGEKMSRQFTAGMLAGTKDTGQRVATTFADTVISKSEGTGEKAGKKFSSEFGKATKSLGRDVGKEIEIGLYENKARLSDVYGTKASKQIDESIVKGTRATGTKVAKQVDDGIVKGTKDTGTKVAKQIEDGVAKANPGKKAGHDIGIQFRSAFAGDSGGNGLVDLLFKGTGALAAASGGAAGIAIGAAVVGGISTALVVGGVVGLAGFLLKDNEKVSKAWKDTFEDITDDAKRRAGFLEDEFVAGADATAKAWETKLGPALEQIFINAEPLVDDFIAMPTNWLEALAPGVEKAVKNAGPAVEGLDSLGTSIFKGLGDGLGDLSEHSADVKVALELIGEGGGKAIKDVLGFVGDLSEKVADNKAAWESWGRGISTVAGAAGTDFKNLMDLAAAASSPDGKNSEGDTVGTALEKLLMGNDYKAPVKGDYNDVRNIGQIGRNVAQGFRDVGDFVVGRNQPVSETKAVKGSTLETELKLLSARKDLNEATDKANYLDSIGLSNSQARIDAGLQISQSQAQLIENGKELTEVTGNNTQANQIYIDAINALSEAGLPASDALLNMVSGMNSTELAALGATVRTDELGNSIVSIPGQKDIVVNAGTLEAQNAIAAVQGAVNSLTGKTVYVNVVTTGVASAASAVAGYASAAAASILGRNKGGLVPGGGPDVDSKVIAVTPQEFVVNRKATAANLPLLEAINKGAGGDTIMQMAGGGIPAQRAATSATGGASSGGGCSCGGKEIRLTFDSGRFMTALRAEVREVGGNASVLGPG